MVTYETKAIDLTHLGGPMGTEHTTSTSLGMFRTLSKAQDAAQEDYNGSRGKIVWTEKDGIWRTQDLRYVMYNVVSGEVK